MIRAKCRVPKLLQHATEQAVARLCGKDHNVGPFVSAEVQACYDALIAEWLFRGRVLAPAGTIPQLGTQTGESPPIELSPSGGLAKSWTGKLGDLLESCGHPNKHETSAGVPQFN